MGTKGAPGRVSVYLIKKLCILWINRSQQVEKLEKGKRVKPNTIRGDGVVTKKWRFGWPKENVWRTLAEEKDLNSSVARQGELNVS